MAGKDQEYTGWRELPLCNPEDGHTCKDWDTFGDWLDEMEDDYNQDVDLESKIYVEVAVPEREPIQEDLQRFLVVGSSDKNTDVFMFFGKHSIRVDAEQVIMALQRACGTNG